MRLLLYAAVLRLIRYVRVDRMRGFLSWFWFIVCYCMLVLRALMHTFAFLCCKDAFLILRVCIACMACFRVFGLLVFRVLVYAFALVCCKAAFHITRVCRLHVSFVSRCWFVCLCLYACFVLGYVAFHIACLFFFRVCALCVR